METYFSRVYNETKLSLWARLRAKTPTPADAEDLLQETYLSFVRILKEKGEDGIENPAALLNTIADRRLADFYSKRGGAPTVSIDEEIGETLTLADVLVADVEVEPAVLTAVTASEVRASLSKKDETTQKIFDLYFLADQPLDTIADALGVKLSFVKNRLYRTLKELRKLYGKGSV